MTKNMVLSPFGLIETLTDAHPERWAWSELLSSFDFDVLELIREHCAHCSLRGFRL